MKIGKYLLMHCEEIVNMTFEGIYDTLEDAQKQMRRLFMKTVENQCYGDTDDIAMYFSDNTIMLEEYFAKTTIDEDCFEAWEIFEI